MDFRNLTIIMLMAVIVVCGELIFLPSSMPKLP